MGSLSDLYLKEIANRFRSVLISSRSLYECLFHVQITPDLCDTLFSNASNLGIETLASEVYQYVHTHMYDQISVNSEYRLLNAIKTSAINSIFFNGTHFISIPEFKTNEINILNSYENIYTLNYAEFWNPKHTCTYLHGQYKLPAIFSNDCSILLYSVEQYNLPEYKTAVNKLSASYNMLAFHGYNIVFSPLLDKQSVIHIGHYPSKHLYPASDLFPGSPPKLYTMLEDITSLDVFGMSPFGDNRIIERLALIPDLTIYVYEMNEPEVSEWNKRLNKKCCKDSSLFWKI